MSSSATAAPNAYTGKTWSAAPCCRPLVERAKDFAIKRAIETKDVNEGISQEDLNRAVTMEYKENEIFPKSDAVEDWLMLLDQTPENVADVKPIRQTTRGRGSAKMPSGVI